MINDVNLINGNKMNIRQYFCRVQRLQYLLDKAEEKSKAISREKEDLSLLCDGQKSSYNI